MAIPSGWSVEIEQTIHDEFIGREYTNVIYRQNQTKVAVYINEVIDGENVWRYNVHHSGQDGDLGVANDLETFFSVPRPKIGIDPACDGLFPHGRPPCSLQR